MTRTPSDMRDDMGLPQFIASTLDKAIDSLRKSGQPGEDIAEGLILMGQLHDAHPVALVVDPILSDSAKVQWLYLTMEARKQPQGAIGMPKIDDVADKLRQSRGTVIRDRLLLRLCRWISLVENIRDEKTGRYLGQVYALHTEPVQVIDAVRYDRGFMALLEEHTESNDRRLRAAATSGTLGLQNKLEQGLNPLERQDENQVRMETMRALLAPPGQAPSDSVIWGAGYTLEHIHTHVDNFQMPGTKSGPGKCPSTNFVPGDEPSTNFGLGKNPSPNFVPGENQSQNPSPNFEPGQNTDESVDNLQEIAPNKCDNEEKENSRTSICTCSSSFINTTTTKQTPVFEKKSDSQELRWHKGFDDNTRRMVMHAIKAQQIAPEHHQDLLDALAHKALNPDDPLRSPVGYTIRLCQRIKDGSFNPVGPPLPQKDDEAKQRNDLRMRIINAKNNVDNLQSLFQHEKVPEARETLAGQIKAAKQRLASLQDTGAAHE